MSLLDEASLIVTPNGYKASKLYSVKPTDGSGDMVVSRGTSATRVNSAGLIELMPINVPRLDYTGGGCPSILVEPARINRLLRSEEFDLNLPWITSLATVTTNATTAPDNTVTADKLVATAVSGTHLILQIAAGSVSGTTATFSVFVKAAGLTRIQLVNNATGGGQAIYNLSTQQVNKLSGVDAYMQNYGNGWYRCIMVYTPTTTPNYNVQIRLAVNDVDVNPTFTGNGVDGVFLWGAQVEEGAYETSYIPTTTATVTRNDDVISKTAISTLIGQAEGTIFWDVKNLTVSTSSGNPDFAIKNTSPFTNWISLTSNTAALPFRITVRPTSGSINIIDYTSAITSAKACVKYGTFGAKLFVNGISVATSAVNPNFSFDSILFRGSLFSYKTNSFMLWKTALTDAQCITLTTP